MLCNAQNEWHPIPKLSWSNAGPDEGRNRIWYRQGLSAHVRRKPLRYASFGKVGNASNRINFPKTLPHQPPANFTSYDPKILGNLKRI
jgi:hypothetical protein